MTPIEELAKGLLILGSENLQLIGLGLLIWGLMRWSR